MRCNECRHNKGYCTKPVYYTLDKKHEAMVYSSWKSNNMEGKCLFWKLGKHRRTHEETQQGSSYQ